MALFANTALSQVLYAIEHTKILALQGKATETILSVLGQQDYGQVTEACKQITQELQQGSDVETAVQSQVKKESHSVIKEFVTLLPAVGEEQFYTQLEDLSEQTLHQKERMKESFLSKLQRGIGKTVFLVAAPFLLFILEFLKQADFYSLTIPNIDIFVYGIALVGLIILFLLMRYKE